MEKGEIFKFGFYYEEIEWLVLEKNENKILAVTKNCIDSMPINPKFGNISWEKSKIRKWLNGVFFDKVFTEKEKKMIVLSEIENPKNKIYGKTDGNKTKDRVFLLSIEEAESFFSSDEERIARATDFAVQNGTKTDGEGNCIWWLRTSGIDSKRFAVVSNAGYIYEIGTYADFGERGIRPAMWIDLSLAE
ncbi:MAG: hypothetical protein IJ406_05310 [Oscillospiraceae bacterium]|nr:hypothetical protein [Oscillospiraceae bacterium]